MAFKNLPIELNERIAEYLPCDSDLCSFTLICQQTNQAVEHIRSGVWRKRFASCYDMPPGKSGVQIKRKYQARRRIRTGDTHFLSGYEIAEQQHLKAVRELILESFADSRKDAGQKAHSNNIEQLRHFVRRSNILQCVLQTDGSGTHELLQTIQLLFIPWSLEFALDCPTHSFPSSQQVVYSHPESTPLFLDKYKTHVNMSFLLHITNFFKYHMTHQQEATLFVPFNDLEASEKPRVWQSHLEQGTKKLGKSWKGSYAYLHDLRDVPIMRSFDAGQHVIIDSIDYADDGFQTLDLEFSPERCAPWPAAFDEHLNSFPSPALLRKLSKYAIDTQPRVASSYPSPPPTPVSTANVDAPLKPKNHRDYFHFTGTGVDADPYSCSGIIHALPPQSGIPGWQRITMMKVFGSEIQSAPSSQPASTSLPDNPFDNNSNNNTGPSAALTGANDVPVVVDESCWAYEGVVLPGGMIMVGRWWSPADDTVDRLGTGPFIFWNVEDN